MRNFGTHSDYAARLALAHGEFFDGISPMGHKVRLRVSGQGDMALIEMTDPATHAVTRWQARELRMIDGQADENALIVTSREMPEARLILRDPDAIRTIRMAAGDLAPLKLTAGLWPRVVAMGAVAATCLIGLIFVAVPFMADRAAPMIPVETEIAMGNSAFTQIYGNGRNRLCTGAAGQAALSQMQARLTQGHALPYPLTLRVIDDPMLQATALPGGHITLYRGLIEAAETPEEVAAVLAHEIGHVAYRDGTRTMLRAMGSFGLVGLAMGDVLGGSVVAGVTRSMINASHSREAEARADDFAHHMLAEAGVPPAALGTFFERIRASGMDVDLGVFRHFSTHPDLVDRITAAEAASIEAASGTPILGPAEWQALRGICGTSGAEAKG